MKIYLPIATLVVLTFVTSVHSRIIHRFRRSQYYANETACVVDDVPYYNGDPVPSSDPCEECKCRTPGFVCTITECEEKEGCQRIKVPGECCSYQCGCKSNGTQYEEGEQIRVVSSPCSKCYCQDNKIQCSYPRCWYRSDCIPEYAEMDCCPRYSNCFNNIGKNGEPDEALPQEGAKDVPVSTTFIPVSISSDVKENPKDASVKDEESKEISLTEASQSDGAYSKDSESTPEELTTVKQSDVITESEPKKDQQQNKPEERQVSDEHQKLDKEPESITSSIVTDSSLQEKQSSLVEDISQATKEPESSSAKQESHDSDKKLEAVTETKKEGRSGTDEPRSEITVTLPASSEEAIKSSEEAEKHSEEKQEQEAQKSNEKDESAFSQSQDTTLAPSSEEKQELSSESSEVEKASTAASLEQKSSEEKLLKDEEPSKHVPPTEISVENSKSEESLTKPSTPQADKQEGREDVTDIAEEKTESEISKEGDSLPRKDTQQEQDAQKSDSLPELPPQEEQKEAEIASSSSDSPIEEAKEDKEITPPTKNGPSKRFADWLDYIPHDFRV